MIKSSRFYLYRTIILLDPSSVYTLVSNLDLSDSESMRGGWGLPKNGLLMPLLGVIYLNGNHAPEEKIWKFLNMLGIYDGRSHLIFGLYFGFFFFLSFWLCWVFTVA